MSRPTKNIHAFTTWTNSALAALRKDRHQTGGKRISRIGNKPRLPSWMISRRINHFKLFQYGTKRRHYTHTHNMGPKFVTARPPKGLAPNVRTKNLTNWEQAMTNPWTNNTSFKSNHSKLRHLRRGRDTESEKKMAHLNHVIASAPNVESKIRSPIGFRLGTTDYHSHTPRKTTQNHKNTNHKS